MKQVPIQYKRILDRAICRIGNTLWNISPILEELDHNDIEINTTDYVIKVSINKKKVEVKSE